MAQWGKDLAGQSKTPAACTTAPREEVVGAQGHELGWLGWGIRGLRIRAGLGCGSLGLALSGLWSTTACLLGLAVLAFRPRAAVALGSILAGGAVRP